MDSSFFVYGTLKRGQCRQHCWPCDPLSVVPAWTRGHLFSRADYPAMTAGRDRVIGESWTFKTSAVPLVVKTLDRIEGTNQPGQPDLYLRELTSIFSLQDQPLGQAYVYLYSTNPEQDGFVKVVGRNIEWPS